MDDGWGNENYKTLNRGKKEERKKKKERINQGLK